MSDQLLTLKETAEYLKVHWQTVRRYIRQGKLKASKVGRNIRIKESDVEAFLSKERSKKKVYEIELRFLTSNRKKIEEKLIKLGAKITCHGHVIDHWYVPNRIKNTEQKNDFYESGKGYGLRIREQDNGYTGKITTSLEVKRLLIPYKHDTCLEGEVYVNDYQESNRLLNLMNYKEIITIDKDRIVYGYKGYKVVIDDIRDFAVGVEIELMSDRERETVIEKMKKVAKEIGLDLKKEVTDKSATFMAMQKFARY